MISGIASAGDRYHQSGGIHCMSFCSAETSKHGRPRIQITGGLRIHGLHATIAHLLRAISAIVA
jgi:hypothetical protein